MGEKRLERRTYGETKIDKSQADSVYITQKPTETHRNEGDTAGGRRETGHDEAERIREIYDMM